MKYLEYPPADPSIISELAQSELRTSQSFVTTLERDQANEVFKVIYGVDGVYTQLQEEFGLSKV